MRKELKQLLNHFNYNAETKKAHNFDMQLKFKHTCNAQRSS